MAALSDEDLDHLRTLLDPDLPPEEKVRAIEARAVAARDLDPDTSCANFRTLLPVDALPSDALSDRQLEVNCDAMLKGIARIARRDRGLAKLH